MARNLYPVFQPIVDEHFNIIGHEALIRGLHAPSIIRMFNRANPISRNRIVRFDLWAKQLAVHAYTHSSRLFLNSHPFSMLTLPDSIRLKAKTPVVIELTEHAEQSEHLLDEVRRLRALGVEFAIDDFGLGFTNLPLLMQIRPKYVKIAKEVVRFASSPNEQRLLESICEMCRSFGTLVIAEGIESHEMFRRVEPYVDAFQGFWISEPQEVILPTLSKSFI